MISFSWILVLSNGDPAPMSRGANTPGTGIVSYASEYSGSVVGGSGNRLVWMLAERREPKSAVVSSDVR